MVYLHFNLYLCQLHAQSRLMFRLEHGSCNAKACIASSTSPKRPSDLNTAIRRVM